MTHLAYAEVSSAEQDARAVNLGTGNCAGRKRIYSDHGTSGTKTNRPESDKMLERLSQGDEVIVWKLDRLGRNTSHLLELLDDFKARGIKFHSLRDGIATDPATTSAVPWPKQWSPSSPPSSSSTATNSPNVPKPAWPSRPRTAAKQGDGKSPPPTPTSSKPMYSKTKA